MEPDPKIHAMYQDYFTLFCSVYEHLKEDYDMHATLLNKYAEE